LNFSSFVIIKRKFVIKSCLILHVCKKQVSQLQYDPNVVDEELQLIFPCEFDHVCTHVYQFALAWKLVPSCVPWQFVHVNVLANTFVPMYVTIWRKFLFVNFHMPTNLFLVVEMHVLAIVYDNSMPWKLNFFVTIITTHEGYQYKGIFKWPTWMMTKASSNLT
jgi:hypothetical protein